MNDIENKLRDSLFTANGSAARSGGSTPIGILYKDLSYAINGAAIQVHKALGPGQLESTYERALSKELAYRGIAHRCQVPITSWYRGDAVGDFVVDMIVEDQVLLELKSVVKVAPVHRSQVLSYLRATGLKLGLLINFHEPVVWRAIKRIVL